MVFLATRSTTNLCDSSMMISHVNHHHMANRIYSPSFESTFINRIDSSNGTTATLPSKIHLSNRFRKLSTQRLHQSNWTLDHRHRNDYLDDDMLSMNDVDQSMDDASLLLLTPYSRSCYLMAQRSRLQQQAIQNRHYDSTPIKSKSMFNLHENSRKPPQNSNVFFQFSSSCSSSSDCSVTPGGSTPNGHQTKNQIGDNHPRQALPLQRKRQLSLTLSSSSTANNIQPISIRQDRSKQQILRAKNRASILWLIAKANDNGRIPPELRNPFYRDHQGQELLKPWITQRMANAELYGRALANIYGVPDYSSFSHQNILQLLTRRGVFSDQHGLSELGEHITETMLLKNCPVKLPAHMIIIECIMMLYIREILIPIKVMEVTSRFSGEDVDSVYTELPPSTDPEDVALYWVNRACAQLNQEIARDFMLERQHQQQQQNTTDDQHCPLTVPSLDELSDMCDGCSLFALIAFYCPEHVDWREICLKQDITITDSIYNLQRMQNFCQELFPSDICFLMLEDFLYLHESIVPNFLAFIADLLFMFEIQPVNSVTPPYLRLYPELYQDEFQPNYPQMLTASEMKAKSLKSSWNNNDSIETSSGGSVAGHLGNEFPPNYQLYDRPSFTNSQRTASNLMLNYHANTGTSSRRNSLVHNKSSASNQRLLSNGNNDLMNQHEQSPELEEHIYSEPSNHMSTNDYRTNTSATQLTTYFSSMNINTNNHPSINNNENNNEYIKNRSRASGGHLTDYFSSLSNINDHALINSTSTNTHVRAQRQHPNNTDNVKQLLTHRQNDHHQPYPFADSQTNSSDTSSVAEMSEYSDQIRAQLNEKRKQIEADRQNERQKRASSDHNFRQEVIKALKNINHQSTDMSQDVTDFVGMQKNQDNEENLTFEVHELNPIRREKTFTSIPSSFSQQTSTIPSITNTTKTSTIARKKIFSASEDLKALMTDLNYANAKEYHSTKTETKDITKSTETLDNEPEPTKSSELTTNLPSSDKSNDIVVEPENNEQSTLVSTPKQLTAQQQTQRRSHWGQPMIPLAGQVHSTLPRPALPQPHTYPQPPAWSQSTANGTYEQPQVWYPNHQSPYHPIPTQVYPYPYGSQPITAIHQSPYDPFNVHHAPPPPTTYMPQPQHDQFMSPIAYPHHTIPSQQQQSIVSSYQNVSQSNSVLTPLSDDNTLNGISVENNNNLNNNSSISALQSSEAIANNISKASDDELNGQQTSKINAQHNETFFIAFNDSKSHQIQKERQKLMADKKKLSANNLDNVSKLPFTGTQALISSNDKKMDDHLKELYNVRRPSIPAVPAVSFVIGADSGNESENSLVKNNDSFANGQVMHEEDQDESISRPRSLSTNFAKSEEEMAKKKEAIMKQSLKRRALQESKRIQKEQEMAAKREHERIKREQMERKKEEEREKRAFILDQYKRKKQLAEEIEKNGGVAALQGTVARSSSTLILNRSPASQAQSQAQVTLRTRGSVTQQRQRPKSLHAALLDECSALSTISSASSRLSSSRDEIDDLVSSCGRLSSTASISASSRPQSAMSSQLCSSTTVSTPTGTFTEHSFGIGLGQTGSSVSNDITSGPTSSNFYQEYNGPKLFVKPCQKSNKTLILNAINVVLAGAVNSDMNRRVTEVINKCDSKYYLILFRNSGLQYRAIYSYNPEKEEVIKLDGTGPRIVHNDMIDKFYKYNSGTKSFTAIQTKHLCVTIDAFTIHNHLWMSKAKQQQLQSTPRRFLP